MTEKTPWAARPTYNWKPEPTEMESAQKEARLRGETLLELISRAVRKEVKRMQARRARRRATQ